MFNLPQDIEDEEIKPVKLGTADKLIIEVHKLIRRNEFVALKNFVDEHTSNVLRLPEPDDDRTALHVACEENSGESHAAIIRYLIEKNVDVNYRTEELRDYCLNLLAGSGSINLVRLLIENGADVNAVDGGVLTPLYHAIQGRNIPVVIYLLDNGANIHVENNDEETPLHYAARYANEGVYELLVISGGRNNSLDRNQFCPGENALYHRSLNL